MAHNKTKSAFTLIGLFFMLVCAPLQASTEPDNTEQVMPKGLWQAFHDVRHKIEPLESEQIDRTWRAVNPGNHLSMLFNSRGLTLQKSGNDSPWQLAMHLQAYGQQQSMRAVRQAILQTDGRRIAYKRGNITEWYIIANKGLEQVKVWNKDLP